MPPKIGTSLLIPFQIDFRGFSAGEDYTPSSFFGSAREYESGAV
jgi:hypothetical protein